MLNADVDGKSGQIAAGDPPLVEMFGQDCPDDLPDRSAVGEDAHQFRSASDLLVEALLRVVRPDPRPIGHEEGGEDEDVRAHVGRSWAALGRRSSGMPTIGACCTWSSSGDGCWKTVRTMVATHGWARRGTLESRVVMKWVSSCRLNPTWPLALPTQPTS